MRGKCKWWCIISLCFLFFGAEGIAIAGPPGHEPKICVNLLSNPDWELTSASTKICPEHFAYFGTLKPMMSPATPAETQSYGFCCPLPAMDILTSESSFVSDSCPEDSVVTGYKREPNLVFHLHCTKINTKRYQLGLETKGTLWGLSLNSAYPWREDLKIKRSDIPPAIRYGLVGGTEDTVNTQGCVGNPPGSLLVAKGFKSCSDFRYRELQFRGIEQDPSQGTPVIMFPPCRRIYQLFSPQPVCAL